MTTSARSRVAHRWVLAGSLISAIAALAVTASLAAGASGASLKTLAFVNPASANSYQISYQCGIIKYAKQYGFDLQTVADDSTFTPQAQIPLLQAASAKSPNALITDPTNATAITPTLKQLKSRGAKIVIYDNPLKDTTVASAAIDSNSFAGGVMLANNVLKQTGGKAEILFIDIAPGALASNARIDGFKSVMKSHPGIKEYGPFYDNFTASKDAAIVDAAVAAHPGLSLVVPSYNSAANAAVQELKTRGKLGKIKVATFDADPSIITGIRSGAITAVVSQQPYKQAQLSLQLAAAALAGKKVTYAHHLPMVLIDKSNLTSAAAKPGLYTTKACNK